MALLEVTDLRTHFFTREGVVRAVDGVSFSLEKGKTLGIVGESGCGKSVTALSVMGLIPKPPAKIVSGSVVYEGQDLTKLPENKLEDLRGREIAMIFQDPMTSLNPTLTVGTQIIETIRRHYDVSKAQARKKAIELLEEVRIPRAADRLDDYPHRFSGGMRQRVMIAIALSCDPNLLIADEPTTALDVTVQASVLDLLDDLRREHEMAMIIITHDMGVVAEAADDILVMYAGQVVGAGVDTRALRPPRTPIYGGPARRTAADRGRGNPRGTPDRDSGPAAGPARPAAGVPVCAALSVRGRRLLYRAAARAARGAHGPLGALGPSRERARRGASAGRGAGVSKSQDGALLEVKDLHKHFPIREGILIERKIGDVKAVDGVSFSIAPGETLGLVGESGSGKSTTGYCVLQLLKPTSGSVRFEGVELTELGREALRRMRREMQIVFQDPYSSLDPRMTVGDIVGEPLVVHRIGSRRDRSARIRSLLDVVGFDPGFTNRYPHEFSGGQRQRIGIARALALSPKLIVCDEPVSALDVSIQAQILNLLKDLQRDFELTYLFIAHDLAVVRSMSDRIAVMNQGRLVEIGPAEEVYTNPKEDYTKALLSAVPIPDPRAMKERKELRRKLRERAGRGMRLAVGGAAAAIGAFALFLVVASLSGGERTGDAEAQAGRRSRRCRNGGATSPPPRSTA